MDSARRPRPEAFAFVMATGILSEALDRSGTRVASAALLAVAVAGFVALSLAGAGFVVPSPAYRWRPARGRTRAYRWGPARGRTRAAGDLLGAGGFACLTVAAASNVLASRILATGRIGVAAALTAFGAAVWVVLGYGVPLRLISAGDRQRVNGTWFMWVVGTQSVAVATASSGAPPERGG
ncbi:hypothetical protein [Nonomuraea sp. NPDC005650]|uniref:SLAC1 family transporter n=1 Tax=Nonomuraea sp. NPDC005650 TaxID=3157045 RepID=UPI0033A4D913